MECLGFQVVGFAMEESLKFEKPLWSEDAWAIGLDLVEACRKTYEGGSLFDVEWILADVSLSDGQEDDEKRHYFGQGVRHDNVYQIIL